MAIPIRNYPYTDYHDLNLDFLLRNWAIFQADLEELKRRVKALEDWRETAEPDINTLKSQMLIVIGDIANIKSRLTLVENEVSVLAGNCKSFYICEDPYSVVTLREGDPLTGNIIDLTDPDTLSAFVSRLRSSLSSYGQINDRYFYYKISAGTILELTVDNQLNNDEFIFKSVQIPVRKLLYSVTAYKINAVTGDITSIIGYGGGLNKLIGSVSATNDPDDYVYDSSEYPEYPYKFIIDSPETNYNNEVRAHFWRSSDYEDFSDIVSGWIKVSNGSITLYFSEVPSRNIPFVVMETGAI